jgi:5-methylcytosine-specific restriction endonuclease McrA
MYKRANLARTKTSQCNKCNKQFLANIRSRKKYCSWACTLESKYAGKPPVAERSRKAQRNMRERSALGLTIYERNVLRNKWKSEGKVCKYCNNDFDTIDHIIPLIRGGNNLEHNLVPACRKCNSSKGSKLLSEWKPEIYA